jgi:hypothetical protein
VERAKTEDGATFSVTKKGTRVRAGKAGAWFVTQDLALVKDTYLQGLSRFVTQLQPRWEAAGGPAEAFLPFAQQATLAAMYVYSPDGKPRTVIDEDLDHPQTRRHLREHAAKFSKTGSPAELAFCAGVLGISVESFEGWIEGERRMQEYR